MSNERDLISRVLTEQDISALVDAGITSKFFLSIEDREAYRWIIDHYSQYSTVPPIDTFKKDGPAYRLSTPTDATQYYVDQIIENYRHALIEDGMWEATRLWDNDESEASANRLFRLVTDLNTEIQGSRAVDLTETNESRLERYRAYQKNDGALRGIPTGFAFLDKALGGWQPGQLITFVGPPKAGKTTLLLLSMIAAHMGYYRPLFIGFEMSNEEQEDRHDAIRAHVPISKLRDGTLTADEFAQLERMTRRLEPMPPMIFTEDTASTMTVSGVRGMIDKYKPDVTFIDGVYMMDDENGERKGSPQALTNITRMLKQTSKTVKHPIGISTQVLEWKMDRKRGVTTNSIGYSSSFLQDSDALVAVENTDDPDIKKVKILAARNAQGMETFIRWDWKTTTFEELEGYEDEDGETAKF